MAEHRYGPEGDEPAREPQGPGHSPVGSSTTVGEEPPFFLKNSCTEAASDSGPTYQGPGKEGRAEQEKLKGKED